MDQRLRRGTLSLPLLLDECFLIWLVVEGWSCQRPPDSAATSQRQPRTHMTTGKFYRKVMVAVVAQFVNEVLDY